MKPLTIKRYGRGGPAKRILLIVPKERDGFWSLRGTVELFGAKSLMPNSALATLMALTPPEVNVEYVWCDESVMAQDWRIPADLAAITGTTHHQQRIHDLAGHFKEIGLPVALGGPYASVNPDRCRGLADHHFIGEAEFTWPRFLRDWFSGRAQAVYHQREHVDLRTTPPPDWSLVRASDYMVMGVQSSRGCPHHCDFCDVKNYVGRHRTKTVTQVMAEVKNAHAHGARTVFFSDDNFIGRPGFARELLTEVIRWNTRQKKPLSFSTQITINAAEDEDFLGMMADARFSVAFVGLETVRRESLAEVNKTHNLKNDNGMLLRRFRKYGVIPLIGLVVGFDHDDETVFDDIQRFLDETASPVASPSLLNAPLGTPLYDRLKKEGRIDGGDWAGEWHAYTNIVPLQMTREELVRRHQKLFFDIYEPEAIHNRITRWLDGVEYLTPLYTLKKTDLRQILGLYRLLIYVLFQADSRVRPVFLKTIVRTLRRNPKLLRRTFSLLAHFRHYYDYTRKHFNGASF